MIRFGLVSFAHVHADGYAWALQAIEKQDGLVKFVAASDSNIERGETKSKEWKVRFFGDYREMLTSGEVDAIIIASENVRHVEEVVAACNSGIHIICEKPVGISNKQLDEMRTALAEHSVVFQTAFVCRFSPAVVEAKRTLDEGTLGDIRAISATNHGRYPGGWFGDAELSGGGAIIDHTVHAVDAIRMLTRDEFASIRAFRGKNLRSDVTVEDNALLYARMARSGIPVSIDCSWSRHESWPTWGDLQISIVCAKGVIRIDAFRPHINVANRNGFHWESLGEDLNVKLIRSFCKAIREQNASRKAETPKDKPSYVDDPSLRADFEAGARAASVAIGAYESIANRCEPIILLG